MQKKAFKESSESILLEAEAIVKGARAQDYGSAKESFAKISALTNEMLDKSELEEMQEGNISATVVCKVLMAVKLSRNSYAHKRDNLVDLAGYSELLSQLQEGV